MKIEDEKFKGWGKTYGIKSDKWQKIIVETQKRFNYL